jgi:hypothetical protein
MTTKRSIATSEIMYKHQIPIFLFLAICSNLIIAPMVYAATSEQFSRSQAWALGLLGVGVLSLSTYLFVVMFQPEKF